jgi:hypothetical protein
METGVLEDPADRIGAALDALAQRRLQTRTGSARIGRSEPRGQR